MKEAKKFAVSVPEAIFRLRMCPMRNPGTPRLS
jgi:hypothetical protein